MEVWALDRRRDRFNNVESVFMASTGGLMGITMRGAALALAALAGACASQSEMPPERPEYSDRRFVREADNPFPANYKVETLAFLRTYLNEPTGIRDAQMSPPVVRVVGGVGARYVACLRFNARKPDGGYIGSRDHLVVFFAGKLDRMTPTREDCRDAAYQPFPELERLTR
jgi:hypothetical protein